jgi:hypothetical protein
MSTIFRIPKAINSEEKRIKRLEEEVESLKKQIAELLLIYGVPDGLRDTPSTTTDSASDTERPE